MIEDSDLRSWPVPRKRRDADAALLSELARSSSDARSRGPRKLHLPRRVLFIGGIVGALLAGGGVAAAVVALQPQAPAVRDVARCYSQVSTDFSSSFPGTEVAVAAPAGNTQRPDVPAQVISACGAIWRVGFPPHGAPAATGQNNPVPALVACVLPSGEAAVFPGDASTCSKLNLPDMTANGAAAPQKAP
ncbi:MAG: hypothetical protein JWO62_3329 [Acidimicrobiaceae bacterium]|jgi:hypothetical protein|nr:hypothetical protein [Acidimicrobiaceae bacterium]